MLHCYSEIRRQIHAPRIIPEQFLKLRYYLNERVNPHRNCIIMCTALHDTSTSSVVLQNVDGISLLVTHSQKEKEIFYLNTPVLLLQISRNPKP